jgi:hypothetical protein
MDADRFCELGHHAVPIVGIALLFFLQWNGWLL